MIQQLLPLIDNFELARTQVRIRMNMVPPGTSRLLIALTQCYLSAFSPLVQDRAMMPVLVILCPVSTPNPMTFSTALQ